jgi:hypothetical protein
MKKENVTLKDCTFNLWHYEGSGLDGVTIDIKVTELSQIQRLVAIFGGNVNLWNSPLELGERTETMVWISYTHYAAIGFHSILNIPEEQYHLMLAGFQGNNSVCFHKPQQLTMIDDKYFVLPEDRTNIKAEFRESQAKVFTITKD